MHKPIILFNALNILKVLQSNSSLLQQNLLPKLLNLEYTCSRITVGASVPQKQILISKLYIVSIQSDVDTWLQKCKIWA